MSDAVLAALITGAISLVGIIITAVWQSHAATAKNEASYQRLLDKLEQQSREDDLKLQAKLENFQAVTNTKIDELTREVREHNNFAKRMPVLEEKAKRTDARLTELERVRPGS